MQVFCKSYTGIDRKRCSETYSHFSDICIFCFLALSPLVTTQQLSPSVSHFSSFSAFICFFPSSYPLAPLTTTKSLLHTCSISSLSFTCLSCLLQSLVILLFSSESNIYPIHPPSVFQHFLLLPMPNPLSNPNHTLPHLFSPSSSSSCYPLVIQVSLPNSLPFWITLRNERKMKFPPVSEFPCFFLQFWLSDSMSPLPLCLTYFLFSYVKVNVVC